MNEVYLCLGGNLGNCLENLANACKLITGKVGNVVKASSIYRSQAWGMHNAPDFYNRVIKIETELEAEELMSILLAIEKTAGRERTEINGYQNRIMDIDILFFNTEIIKTTTLEIPHPRLHARRFVIMPLCEIAPDLIHPLLHKTSSQLLIVCNDTGGVKKVNHAI